MKKLVSLALVLALVLCLATVAFAAGTGTSVDDPVVVSAETDIATVDVDVSTIKWFKLPASWSGKVLQVSAPMSGPAIYVEHPMLGTSIAAEGFMSASYMLEGEGDFLIGIGSSWGYALSGATCTLITPVKGSEYTPEEITSLENPVEVTCIEGQYGPEYYVEWTAEEKSGMFTLNAVSGDYNCVRLVRENGNSETHYNGDPLPISIALPKDETITVMVEGMDITTPVSLSFTFEEAPVGSELNPIIIEDQPKPYTFEVELNEDGSPVYYALSDAKNAILSIKDAHANIDADWDTTYIDSIDDGDDDVCSVQLTVFGDQALINVYSGSSTDKKYTVTVSEPEGYDENPEIIDSIDEINAEIAGGLEDNYYYQWTATETGKLTLNVADSSEWHPDYDYATVTETDPETGDPIAWIDMKVQLTAYVNGEELVSGVGGIVAEVTKGDVVTLLVKVLPAEFEDYTEDYGYGAYVDIIGELAALGSENNPYVINSISDLTGIDAASGDTYYVINSMLAGKLLVLEADENLTYTLNGKKVEAGEHELVPAGPTIRLVVTNADEEEIEIPAAIIEPKGSESNPVQVEAGESKAELAAGEEMHYIANSKMDGMTLAVKGEGAYIIVDGKKYEAKNGVASVVLKAAGPTISVIIGNAGTEAGNFAITVAFDDNANTGDASAIFTAIAAAVMSMTGTVALVAKKKEN